MNRTCTTISLPPVTLPTPFSVSSLAAIDKDVFQTQVQLSFVNYYNLTSCNPEPTALLQISNIILDGTGTGGIFGITPFASSSPQLTSSLSSGQATSSPARAVASLHLSGPLKTGLDTIGAGLFVALCSLAIFFWRQYRKRKRASAAGEGNRTVDASQPYLQQKSELEAQERGKDELEAHERSMNYRAAW